MYAKRDVEKGSDFIFQACNIIFTFAMVGIHYRLIFKLHLDLVPRSWGLIKLKNTQYKYGYEKQHLKNLYEGNVTFNP